MAKPGYQRQIPDSMGTGNSHSIEGKDHESYQSEIASYYMDSMLVPVLCLQLGHDKAVRIVDQEGQNPSAYGIRYHYQTERDWSEDDSYDRSLSCVMKFLEYVRRLMS